MKKKIVVRTLVLLFCLVWLVIAALPFVFMVLSSFKGQFEVLTNGVFALPEKFSFDNYVKVLSGNFPRYLLNSIMVTGISLTLLLATTSCAAFVFARLKFKVTTALFGLVVACMSIPIHVAFIPVFILTKNIGLYDSIGALVGPYVAFNLPISVFILTGFMKLIPSEMEEAASIDGCSLFSTFFRIILPLSLPGLATLGIYNSINMWNEFSFAMVLTQSPNPRTLPLAIWEYQGEYTMDTPKIMTVLTLSAVPMVIAFIIGQDKLIKGMMAGSVKG
ncbi:carbohydrate ABC transporter permease [Eubacteriales bacterium OttesenSCG-928-N13]|nr:carbohydrate ABC transporter permease [Eubacteriales bacterium OttesenSCG-928-N13]